jgi:succinate dehydrogenase / fumarate reductase iron-sulfur subunit
VWRCRTIFNCTEACPREIRITKAIGEVKKAILKSSRDIPVRQAAATHG